MNDKRVDKIFLHNIKVPTLVGTLPHEKNQRQIVVFDIEYAVDSSAMSQSDDINSATNYAALRDDLIEFVGNSSFSLIETLAHESADHLRQRHHLTWLRLTLTKPHIFPDDTIVGITIERDYGKD